MQKITPLLWFDGKAVEVMNVYVTVFKKFKGGERHSLWRGRARPEAGFLALLESQLTNKMHA